MLDLAEYAKQTDATLRAIEAEPRRNDALQTVRNRLAALRVHLAAYQETRTAAQATDDDLQRQLRALADKH